VVVLLVLFVQSFVRVAAEVVEAAVIDLFVADLVVALMISTQL